MLEKAELVGGQLCQGRNDNEKGGFFDGLFAAPKINFCLTIDKHGILLEHKTFKSFRDSEKL